MAKRTNKTDHVLNLISSGSTKHNTESSDPGIQTPPPVDPFANNNPQVSIVQSSAKEEKAVADTIRNSLEQELEHAVEQKSETLSDVEEVEAAEAADAVDAVLERVDEQQSDKPAEKAPIATAPVIPKPAAKEKKTEPKKMEPKKTEQNSLMPKPNEPEQLEEFAFVNVMEYIVRDKVVNYMEQFGNCTCSRCVEDTTALTLTHLPAKYVVVNKNAISPLLDYYGHKFAGQMTVEITKACIKVHKFPHHGRE